MTMPVITVMTMPVITVTVMTMPVITVTVMMAAVIAAVAAEGDVKFDTCIGVWGADGGGANCDGERGSSSHKGFLQHGYSPRFKVHFV